MTIPFRSSKWIPTAARNLRFTQSQVRPWPILISRSNSARASSKGLRETATADQLPSYRVDVDGQRAKPLEPFEDGKPKKGRKSKKASAASVNDSQAQISQPGTESGIDAQYATACQAGIVPDTPLAKEVFTYWKLFPNCILLMRVGKFYESYFDPAIEFSKILGLKLAYKQYTNGVYPFSGFPVHQIDKYLKILADDLGHTVVVVEEYDEEGRREPPDPIRKHTSNGIDLKDRRVGRVVTPGTLVDESWLAGNESRYLLAIAAGENKGEKTALSLAYTDASTGEFFLKDTTMEYIEDEMARIMPREVVLHSGSETAWRHASTVKAGGDTLSDLFNTLRVLGVHVSFADPAQSPPTPSDGSLQPDVALSETQLDTQAISILRQHLQYALRDLTPELMVPNRQATSDTMLIDAATLSALEIRHAIRPGGLASSTSGEFGSASPLSTRGTLLSTMARTMTPGGHRLLVRTLASPSTNLGAINHRLDLVQAFVEREELRLELRESLGALGDVMRIVQRFRSRRGDGREAFETGKWLRDVEKLLERIRMESQSTTGASDRLNALIAAFEPLGDLVDVIEGALDESALLKSYTRSVADDESDEGVDEMLVGAEDPVSGGFLSGQKRLESRKQREERVKVESEIAKWWMRPGFDDELAKLHREKADIERRKAAMQSDLRKKLKNNNVELVKIRNSYTVKSSAKLDFAALDKSRRLVPIGEGKAGRNYAYNPWTALGSQGDRLEEEMLLAQRRAFDKLRDIIVERSEAIQLNAEMVDELDMCLAFAHTAEECGYVRPTLDDSTDLDIVNGRHPTVEASLLQSSRAFTPNSTTMTPESHLHIITGPNQGGKSTLLRQTAVIAILAQSGSFVPADSARIGIVDKVFSRIGARDDLFRDRSTFMLEMVETAAILRHATDRSLVIMDEIGRGTTLHSGLSIAFATLDHILSDVKCRTLFATHYHEVADMLRSPSSGGIRAGVEFWCTDVDEVDGAFSYQYHLNKGVNRQSHAIKAAKLAGMPESFLATATRTLAQLESGAKT